MTSDRKIFSQANNAKISAKLSNQQKINILTKNIAKNAKLSYSLAKKKGTAGNSSAKQTPTDVLQDRIFTLSKTIR